MVTSHNASLVLRARGCVYRRRPDALQPRQTSTSAKCHYSSTNLFSLLCPITKSVALKREVNESAQHRLSSLSSNPIEQGMASHHTAPRLSTVPSSIKPRQLVRFLFTYFIYHPLPYPILLHLIKRTLMIISQYSHTSTHNSRNYLPI